MKDDANKNLDKDELIRTGDDNRITEVIVYTDQAYLKRHASVRAQEGLNRFLVEIEAFMVDVESAQANVYGEGEILSVQYQEIPVKHARQKVLRELELKKEKLDRRRRALRYEKEVGDKQVKFLDSVIGFAETDLPRKIKTQFPTTENLGTMLEFLGERYRNIADRDGSLQHQLDELDKEITLVERRLKKSKRPKEKFSKVVEVVFESIKKQNLNIEVSYVAASATWQPVYKVDVPLDFAGVGMTMLARIQQKTGENWENVKLAVSNAVPLKGAELPDLQSWHLNLPVPDVMMAGAVPVAVAAGAAEFDGGDQILEEEGLEDFELSDEAGMAPEASFQQAKQKELPLAFEYELPQQITLNSGDGDTLLPLYTKKMAGDFFIHSVPQNDPLNYLVGRILPDSALLAGRLNVHFGGRFVGGTVFKEKKAGQDLLINLGADRSLKVEREKITDKLAETFFGRVERSMAARELEYRIQIENLKEEPVVVELFDSIPVSKTDRFQVKGLELTPEPKVRDFREREGVMKWELQLKPKAIEEIRIKFFVKHPKDLKPQGL